MNSQEEEYKKIREKLQEMEAAPPPFVWDQLQQTSAYKKAIQSSTGQGYSRFIWFIFPFVALIGLGYWFIQDDAVSTPFLSSVETKAIARANEVTTNIQAEKSATAKVSSSENENETIQIRVVSRTLDDNEGAAASSSQNADYKAPKQDKNVEPRPAQPTGKSPSKIATADNPTKQEAAGLKDAMLADYGTDEPFKSMLPAFTSLNMNLLGLKLEDNARNLALKDLKVKRLNPEALSFFIGIYGGPSLSYRTFQSNHNLMHDHKNTHEGVALTWDAGIEVGVNLRQKWQLAIGSSLDNFSETYDFSGQKEVHDTSHVLHTDPNTGLVSVDTVIAVHSENVGHNTTNSYRFVSIPISIGYMIHLGPRFTLTPSLGLNVDVIRNGNASWLHPETLEPMLMTSNTQYKKWVLGSQVQLGIEYHTKGNFDLMLRPRLRMVHQSIFVEEDLFNHRPYGFDLNFGIRYNW